MTRPSLESESDTREGSSSHQQPIDASDAEVDGTEEPSETSTSLNGSKVSSESNTTPPKNSRCLWLFIMWFGACMWFAFAAYYAYETLISPNPALGALFFPPSATVLVINIFSQITGFALLYLVSATFTRLRWTLLCDENGPINMHTALALDGGTTLYGVFLLLWRRGNHHIWCFLRLICPLLSSVLGFILTVGIDYRMDPIMGIGIPIYGGLTPVNATLVSLVKNETETTFFTAWSYAISQSSEYVVGVDPVSTDCGKGCSSIFLPGGVEMARLRTNGLNETLFAGQTTLADSDMIVISDAPGYQLEFYQPQNYSFNASDCFVYGLDQGEPLHVCLGSENSTIFAGWSACPTSLFQNGNCGTNLSWTDRLDQIIAMNSFKRYSTTAYSPQNLSILSLDWISSPEPYEPDVTALRQGLNAVLGSNTNVTSAYLTQIGWFLRLYQDEFKYDTGSPTRLLEGQLIVQQQFTVNAWQFANASLAAHSANSSAFALPPDLQATAAPARYRYRAISKYPATVYTFIGIGSSLLLSLVPFLCFLFRSKADVPNASHFSEVDLSSRSGYPIRTLPDNPPDVLDYGSKMRRLGLSNANSMQIVADTKNRFMRFAEIKDEAEESFRVLVVGDSKELERTLGGATREEEHEAGPDQDVKTVAHGQIRQAAEEV